MRTIWKFDIDEAAERAIKVEGQEVIEFNYPLGSIVLDVQMQDGRPVFWVDLQDQNTPNVHRFAVIGTGWRIPLFVDCWEGTWQQDGYVWHLYSISEALYRDALKREQLS